MYKLLLSCSTLAAIALLSGCQFRQPDLDQGTIEAIPSRPPVANENLPGGGLPDGCFELIIDQLAVYHEDGQSAEETLFAIDGNCGEYGFSRNPTTLLSYDEQGLPLNCRTAVKYHIDEYRGGDVTIEDTLDKIDEDCGEQGKMW